MFVCLRFWVGHRITVLVVSLVPVLVSPSDVVSGPFGDEGSLILGHSGILFRLR